MLTAEQRERYESDGYLVIPGVFAPDEVERLKDHFMTLRAAGSYPGDLAGADLTSDDPLKRFPRMIHMHRWDDDSLQWLLDKRLCAALTDLLGREPFAVQTMLYFKPAGARGQALHQDQFYLRVSPGTCLAAWLALDPCDEQNGCMQIVPGSHTLPVLCTERADTKTSFTDVTVPLPPGRAPVPVLMTPGDVLFFNGQVIHGSFPNTSADRFRRSLIGHYIVGDAQKVGGFYDPVLRMNGTRVVLEHSEGGGPCGVWRDDDGASTVEMTLPAEPEMALHE
jgi:phytanoyl-CoA hydroxylase